VQAEAVLEAILSAKFPVIICGGGIVLAGGEAEFRTFVEGLDIAVATTISGQGSLAETHPNCVGVVGSNGGVPATREVVNRADLVVFIGCRAGSVTTELWRVPTKQTRIVHVDCDPQVISASYETEASLVSDAHLALKALNNLLASRTDKPSGFGGAAAVAVAKEKKWAAFRPLAESSDRPIKPERTIAALRAVLDDDAIVVADPGTPCPYVSAYYEVRQPGRTLFSNRAHGALGYAMSAAMGAWFGRPDKKVVSLMGDGSFGFTCGELETAVRRNMPITFIVFSNSVYGWIKAGQRAAFAERYFSVDFNRTDHAAVASAFGVKSWKVEDPAQLQAVLKEAVEHDGPTLVDIISQPLNEAAAPVSEWIA
jgi:acetolactate synthase-1/2/3 large subunit